MANPTSSTAARARSKSKLIVSSTGIQLEHEVANMHTTLRELLLSLKRIAYFGIFALPAKRITICILFAALNFAPRLVADDLIPKAAWKRPWDNLLKTLESRCQPWNENTSTRVTGKEHQLADSALEHFHELIVVILLAGT